MTKKLTIQDYTRVLLNEDGCAVTIYPVLENGLPAAIVKFNLKTQTCEILQSLDSINKEELENCVYNHRISELEKLKSVSHEDTFEILDNLLSDLQQKIHK